MDVQDASGEDEEVDGMNHKDVASALLKNPALMSALQGKLDSMVGMNSGYIAVIFVSVCLVLLYFPSRFSFILFRSHDECHYGFLTPLI